MKKKKKKKKKSTKTRTYQTEVVLLHQAYLRHIVKNKLTAANMAHKKAHECKSIFFFKFNMIMKRYDTSTDYPSAMSRSPQIKMAQWPKWALEPNVY